MELDEKKLANVLAARGLHTQVGRSYLQKILRVDPLTGIRVVAHICHQNGINGKRLPVDAGVLTKELALIAQERAAEISREVWLAGTPLAAFFSEHHLAEQLVIFWKAGFAKPIPQTTTLGGLSVEEVNSRAAVAAQTFARLLQKRYLHNGTITLDENTFEPFCIGTVRLILAAFDDPNRYNHLNIHGVDPKEDPEGPPVTQPRLSSEQAADAQDR